jgi:hypothetical protein
MTIEEMGGAKIKAIVPWFGSKRSMGPTIAEELGRHRAYFSLGCGSMADLFAKAEDQDGRKAGGLQGTGRVPWASRRQEAGGLP